MKTASLGVILWAFFVAACSGNAATDASADQPAQASATALSASDAEVTRKTAEVSPAPASSVSPAAAFAESSAVAAAAPQFREVRVPAGTVLRVVLGSTVGSETSNVEDAVSGRLGESVRVRGVTAIPAGATVSGVVTEAKRSGKVKGRARVGLRFTSLRSQGETYRIRTAAWAAQAPGTKKKDAAKIAVPAAGGAVVGAIAGGKKGAAIGAAVGGGAGTGVVLATRGEEVRLPAGRVLRIRLTQPVTVRVPVGR